MYAVGLYLDGTGARQALQKFRGQSAAKLAGNQAFFDGVPATSVFPDVVNTAIYHDFTHQKPSADS